MSDDPSILGVIAGTGQIPLPFVREAKEQGRRVVAVTFYSETKELLTGVADEVHHVSLTRVGKLFKILHQSGVVELAFIGKVDKRALYDKLGFDLKAISVIRRIRQRTDDGVMLGIIEVLEEDGFRVVAQDRYMTSLMPGEGILTRRAPDKREARDVEFGLAMAKGVAGLDIGQTVVVKNLAVMAVEAIEGTDECIERGGRIARGGAVVCKVAKPGQDPRFDIPAVGVATIEAMYAAGATVLAVEAGRTIIVDREEVTARCDRYKIALAAAPLHGV